VDWLGNELVYQPRLTAESHAVDHFGNVLIQKGQIKLASRNQRDTPLELRKVSPTTVKRQRVIKRSSKLNWIQY